MQNQEQAGPRLSTFRSRRRNPLRISRDDLVRTGRLEAAPEGFPLVLEPDIDGLDVVSWAEQNRSFLDGKLLAHGAVLLRGFDVESADRFQALANASSGRLLDYRERAAPRQQVGEKVYSSTEFPPNQWIPLHHEMSYSHNWPRKIFFYCDQPPRKDGCTPIADDRQVIDRIDPEVKEQFLKRGVMYVRNYGEGVDLPWREAFQTDDRAQVEEYGRRTGMEVEWRGGERLRTRARRQVMVTHPETGDRLWFNHAHMFHSSNLEPAVREALLGEFAPEELPRNAFYGDGGTIEDDTVEHVRRVYREASVRFPWQQGDVLVVDNMLVSHGREPFEPPRRILVAMADLFNYPDVQAPTVA